MGLISFLQSRKALVSAKITDWMIVCYGNCWFVCIGFRERGETSLFQHDRICNPKCKMSGGCKMHIDACSSRTAVLKASSDLTPLPDSKCCCTLAQSSETSIECIIPAAEGWERPRETIWPISGCWDPQSITEGLVSSCIAAITRSLLGRHGLERHQQVTYSTQIWGRLKYTKPMHVAQLFNPFR